MIDCDVDYSRTSWGGAANPDPNPNPNLTLTVIGGLHGAEQLVSALGRYRTALQAETKRVVEEKVTEIGKVCHLQSMSVMA